MTVLPLHCCSRLLWLLQAPSPVHCAELWAAVTDFPAALDGAVVSSFDELLASNCSVVISAIAPRLGFLDADRAGLAANAVNADLQ